MEGREANGQLAPCEQLSVQQRSFNPSSGDVGSEKEKDSCVVPSEADHDQSRSQNFPPVLTFPLCQETVFRQLSAVLLCGSGPLPAGEVRGAWSAYLDTVVEPTGWEALLLPSSSTAALLGCQEGRPGGVCVQVCAISPESMEAEVDLLAAPVDSPPDFLATKGSLLTVSLDELYPLRDQVSACCDLTATAVALDLLRFFYQNLWMPWDDDSDSTDWPRAHLSTRTQLAFDFVNGTGDQETASRLDELAVQAEMNRTQLEELEDAVGLGGDGEVEPDDETIVRLFRLHQEKEKIREEAENLENPLLRRAERVAKIALRRNSRTTKEKRAVLAVWKGGSAQKLEDEMVSRVREQVADEEIIVLPDLQQALDIGLPGDIVVICSDGEHRVEGLGGLTRGGQILGRAGGEVVIAPGDTLGYFLQLEEGSLKLSNLSLKLGGQYTGILMGEGTKLEMSCVKVEGGEVGVKVKAGGSWKLEDCSITDSKIGLEVLSESNGSMSKTRVEGCTVGVYAESGASMDISNGSRISSCKEQGILLRGQGSGVWRAEAAVVEAAKRGIAVADSEICMNVLGDLAVVGEEEEDIEEEMLSSPLEPRHLRGKRCSSTPRIPLLSAADVSGDKQ